MQWVRFPQGFARQLTLDAEANLQANPLILLVSCVNTPFVSHCVVPSAVRCSERGLMLTPITLQINS